MSITGQRLKERRKQVGMSADDVSTELGVSRTTIFRYENGAIEKVPANIIEKLAEILNTTPAYLMGWTDNPEDWERIANDEGICPPNDFDGEPEYWYRMKKASEKDYYSDDRYYLNDETRQIAQDIFEDSNMRTLFKIAKDMKPDRLKAHLDFMKKLAAQERGDNDEGC